MKFYLGILKISQNLISFGNLSQLFIRTNHSDPVKNLEDTFSFPENIIFQDMGHKKTCFLMILSKNLYEILSWNLENLSEFDQFWQLIAFVSMDKLLRPWQKIRRHLWPSRKYNILRYGT